jgi:hypothetical protein
MFTRALIILTLLLPYTMSGTVMELSAIFVERMIFLKPSGGDLKTDCCSSVVMDECSGLTHHLRSL